MIKSYEVLKLSPSGEYFYGVDTRASLNGRTPDMYLDFDWFDMKDIAEVIGGPSRSLVGNATGAATEKRDAGA